MYCLGDIVHNDEDVERLRAKGLGVTITTQQGETIVIPAFAFVDDTDLLQQLEDENDVESPQNAVNEWATDLQTTGGSLVGDKCFYQVITHKWEQDTWIIDPHTNERIKISIKNEQGEPIPIKQSSCYPSITIMERMNIANHKMKSDCQYNRVNVIVSRV